MNEAARFLQRCRLTCMGGSEKGSCPCEGPMMCEERKSPLFSLYRFKAEERMRRILFTPKEKT